MNNLSFDFSATKNHFKQNASLYFGFLSAFIIGIAIGFVITFSTDTYINILVSSNRVLHLFINGTAHIGTIFARQFFSFLLPMLLVFLLNLNVFSGLLSFVIVTYQSALLVLSSSALILVYGSFGVLDSLLLMLPVNIIYLFSLSFFSVICLNRSIGARRYKNFAYELNSGEFWLKLLLSVGLVFLDTIIASVIYPIFLKNAIYVIF